MTRLRRQLLAALALLAWVPPSSACGFEDPGSVTAARGILNFVYPQSLHVISAVWRAELDGELERDAAPAAVRALVGYRRSTRALETFGSFINNAAPTPAPAFSIVLLTPMLWTRFHRDDGAPVVTPHVNGPDACDVVIVTDESVVAALAKGSLGAGRALELGLVRFYGPGDRVREVEKRVYELIARNVVH